MNRISSKRNNKKIITIFGVIGLVIILFVNMNHLRPINGINYIPNFEKKSKLPLYSSAITNVTDANLTVLYPSNITQYYIEPLNGFGSGIVENLKNETEAVTTAELYPSSDYGNVSIVVTFDATGLDIGSMTLFTINWEGRVISTASSVVETKFNIYIDNQGGWELLHNATNSGNRMIDRKIGWWEHEITSNFNDYITANTITLKFEAEQTLTSIQSSWYHYLILYWTNIVFGKNVEFTKINATSIDFIYNDTAYQQTGDLTALESDEDGNTLSIQLNELETGGRTNITFDIVFDLLNFSYDEIYGFKYYHDDWLEFYNGSIPSESGTIKIQNTTSSQLLPILNLRTPHVSYNNLYPKQGFAAYTISGTAWWNGTGLRIRYSRDIMGVNNWSRIKIDLGYIEIARRTSPIFSVSLENSTRYIDEIEYVQIFVQNYRSQVTDIQVLSSEGNEFVNNTEGNYTFAITRATSGWYNFSVQIIDDEEHLVTKGEYKIWFQGRPINIAITLTPIPQKIQCTLVFTDSVYGYPVPNKNFDLWIYRYGETFPYASYPGLSTNSSGMFVNNYSVSPYLDEWYTFNVTSPATESYGRCSVLSSVECDYVPPTFTITNVVYSSQYSGETVTIYYTLEDWTISVMSASLRENGNFITSIPISPGSNQISFETISGNNNYTLWAINVRGQIGESKVINLNLKLRPLKMDILTFYVDNFFYFLIDIKDNETGSRPDGIPVRVSAYDSGFLLFSGTVETHSIIIGGFPFDQNLDHLFLFKAEITTEHFINLEKEAQLPFQAYPLWELVTLGLILPGILGGILIFRLGHRKWKTRRPRRYQNHQNLRYMEH